MINIPHRPRRNRKSKAVREMIRETSLSTANLVQPIFLLNGNKKSLEIKSLPGISRLSLDNVLLEVNECIHLGINTFIMFPVVEDDLKDQNASYGLDEKNFYLQAARKIKEEFPNVTLISDVAMDPYSSDGHDGLVLNGKIVNDKTLVILGEMSLRQAEAGFDMLGPSDMMDGRVGYIRDILDENNFTDTSIMSYSVKYASAMYGPFRDALSSAPKSGDKKTYQMDPANTNEAILEAGLDIEEGADFIMVKPALHYLDIIQKLHTHFDTPVACYHVSGECAMLRAACQNGWLDFNTAMPETLLSMKRAGATAIITYFAKEYGIWSKKNS